MWHIRRCTSQNVIEERCAHYIRSFTLDTVSQLDRDASTALATIREWRNSFAPINRIPMDILSLIPTHLPTQKDRFGAASVCRHWRGVLLKHGALWSQLFLRKGEECISTLLERAKGSPLDIIIHRDSPAGTIAQIAPRTEQIVHLEFLWNYWQDIITFSESNHGKFPHLRTLKFDPSETYNSHGRTNVVTPPSLPFFGGSTNLENFTFRSWRVSFLSHFVFPNLTTFELFSTPAEECSALCLLNFLEASPMLQTVEINISTHIILGGVPREMVVVLPNVKTFSLHVTNDTTTYVYDIAAHISCPSARYTSLTHEMNDYNVGVSLEVFPAPDLWNAIVHQHAAGPIEEVTLEVKHSKGDRFACSLTFQSPNAAVVKLGLHIHETGVDEGDLNMSFEKMGREVFSQALTTTCDHPLVSHVKRLHIKHRAAMSDTEEMLWIADKVRELFGSLGPLDKLTIHGCDLHMFLIDFLDDPELDPLEGPIVFPQINELTVSHPQMEIDEMECMDAIAGLAESQHALGIPFERVAVRMWSLPAGMVEELGRWVGTVDCLEEWYEEEDA